MVQFLQGYFLHGSIFFSFLGIGQALSKGLDIQQILLDVGSENKLILTSNLSIDIKDIDGLFSFLNTSKKSRKDIKNIKLNIIYDFLSNQIELKNIKINDNDVSSQFSNIAEGFIDINSNNLTKSRKLLNELIDLYEG